MPNTQYIRKLNFFSELPNEELEKIAAISIERNYKRNRIIFMEGEPGEAFYYIIAGKVKVFRSQEDGKEHIIHILGPGDVFGEATLLSHVSYPASALVYEDAVIGMIKNSDLESLIRVNPELALRLLQVFAQKLILTQQKIRDLTFYDVFSRTASQLIKLASEHGSKTEDGVKIGIALSRQELAEMVGTTRETISRVMSRFKKEISVDEKDDQILIVNEEKLRGWLE